MMATALSAALMLPAFAVSSDHRGDSHALSVHLLTAYRVAVDHEMVGSTL
jgi:hypothetical protein